DCQTNAGVEVEILPEGPVTLISAVPVKIGFCGFDGPDWHEDNTSRTIEIMETIAGILKGSIRRSCINTPSGYVKKSLRDISETEPYAQSHQYILQGHADRNKIEVPEGIEPFFVQRHSAHIMVFG